MLSEIPTQFALDLFSTLRLTSRHAAVYLALIELGSTTVSNISKHTTIPRSTIYELLGDLISAGCVNYVGGQSKAIYTPEAPQKIAELVERSIDRANSVKSDLVKYIPIMNSAYATNFVQLPNVKYYQGDSGIETVLFDCLNYNDILALCIDNEDTENMHFSDELKCIREFAFELRRRKKRIKEIMQKSVSNNEYKNFFESDIHQIKLIKKGWVSGVQHIDKQVYGNRVAYISWDSKVGVIIEDVSIARAEAEVINQLWNSIK